MVLGQGAGLVVARHARRQRLQVLLHLQSRDAVDVAAIGLAAHVVDPQHVVPLGSGHGARHLELERLVHDVVDAVALAEAVAGHAFDERIELGLRVGLVRREGELQRQEHPPVVVPHARDRRAHAVEFRQRAPERHHGRLAARGGPVGLAQFVSEPLFGRWRVHPERRRRPSLSEQRVERQHHVFERDAPRPPRRPVDRRRGAVAGQRRAEKHRPRVEHARQHVGRASEFAHGGDVGRHRPGRIAVQAALQRHRHPRHRFAGTAELPQGVGERGRVSGHRTRRRDELRLVVTWTRAACRLPQGHGHSGLQRLAACGNPFQAQAAAVAEHPAPPHVEVGAHEPVGALPAHVVVDAGVQPDERAHGQQAQATLEAVGAAAGERFGAQRRQAGERVPERRLDAEHRQAGAMFAVELESALPLQARRLAHRPDADVPGRGVPGGVIAGTRGIGPRAVHRRRGRARRRRLRRAGERDGGQREGAEQAKTRRAHGEVLHGSRCECRATGRVTPA